MTLTTTPTSAAKFQAEIAWLGPIIGAPCRRNGTREVTIAGAEDPALGKTFCAALVPVVAEVPSGRYAGDASRRVAPTRSDRHGWFHVVADTDLWEGGADGVLFVLLYNQSIDLLYYTLDDLPQDRRPELAERPSLIGPDGDSLPAADAPGPSRRDHHRDRPAIDELLNERGTLERCATGSPKCRPGDRAVRQTQRETSCARAAAELAFALASCQYPSVMIEGGGRWRLVREARHVADTSGRSALPQCLLLVGDQIYVDGTAGLFDPTSQFDRFVRPYEILFGMKPVRDVLRRLPAIMMMDDHEIFDNWEPVRWVRNDPVMIEGRRSYFKFQRRVGPDRRNPEGDSRHPLWCEFTRQRLSGVHGRHAHRADAARCTNGRHCADHEQDSDGRAMRLAPPPGPRYSEDQSPRHRYCSLGTSVRCRLETRQR